MMCFGLKQINNEDKIIENNLKDILIQADIAYHYQKYVRQNNVCSFLWLQAVQSGIHSHTDDQIKTCNMKTCHTKLARL